MGQGRRSQAFCLHILLIALAIQGITPDSNDLASINALKLFCPRLTDADQMVDEDEFPDDVCEPVRVQIDLGRCQLADLDGLPFARFATAEAQMGRVKSDALQFVARRGTLTRIDGLIHSLCRLKC
jgi:hypothetical protein